MSQIDWKFIKSPPGAVAFKLRHAFIEDGEVAQFLEDGVYDYHIIMPEGSGPTDPVRYVLRDEWETTEKLVLVESLIRFDLTEADITTPATWT